MDFELLELQFLLYYAEVLMGINLEIVNSISFSQYFAAKTICSAIAQYL